MKVLVTGNTGILGSTLMKLGNKYNVLEFIPFSTKSNPRDILDRACCSNALVGIDLVVHLASILDYKNASQNEYKRINVDGTKIICEEALKNNIQNFIYISSQNIYDNSKLPVNGFKENSPKRPITLYAKSKLAAEIQLKKLGVKKLLILRPSNIIGDRLHTNSLFYGLIQNIINENKIYIYGQGKRIYDFIAAIDICKIIIRAINHNWHGIYNLGAGKKYTVLEIASYISKITCVSIEHKFIEKEKSDAYLDCNKIEMITKINRRPLEDVIEQLLKLYKIIGINAS
jgi:nucleoside-diphosphate-sugar epimerase